MALDQTANFIRGNADGSVTASETTIDVLDASIFPDPSNGSYNVVIWDANTFPRPDQDADVEILRVTGRDTGNDTLTVNRGQEGTLGTSHPDESAIHLSPTAKMFSDIQTKTQGLSDDGTSLNIENLTNTDVSIGSTKTIHKAKGPNNAGAKILTQTTNNLSTSATAILSTTEDVFGYEVTIIGDEQNDNSRFFDVVAFSGTPYNVTVQQSHDANAPDGRTYSASSGSLQLSMASNSYDVVATAKGSVRDFNLFS